MTDGFDGAYVPVHFVTAVSRPENLVEIKKSIQVALFTPSAFKVVWVVVCDRSIDKARLERELSPTKMPFFEIVFLEYPGGPCDFGVSQKNMALDWIKDGWFNCLDDDNIVHPGFLHGLNRWGCHHPKALGFIFSQKRWDGVGSLPARPELMRHGTIDNAMMVLHRRLIGPRRYNLTNYMCEDWTFFEAIWRDWGDMIWFADEELCYYNFLKQSPDAPKVKPW